MRRLKYLAWTLGALLALIVLGAVTLTQFIDPNRFRTDVESAVRNATGRELDIHGPLALSWFPWLALTLRDSSIAAAPGTAAFVSWREARVGARLLPLIDGRLAIDRVRIDGLVVKLERDANGRANWEPAEANQPANAVRSSRPVTIAGIDLRDATVEFMDQRKQTRWLACKVELTTTAIAPGQPVRGAGSLRLTSGVGTDCAAARPLQWAAEYRPQGATHAVHDLTLATVGPTSLALSVPALSIDLQSKKLTAAAWQLTTKPGSASSRVAGGPLELTLGDTVAGRGSVRFETASPRAMAAALGWTLPKSRDAAAYGNIDGRASFDIHGAAVDIRTEGLLLDRSRLRGYARRGGEADAAWVFDAELDSLALDGYLPPRDPAAPPFKFPSEQLATLQARGELRIKVLRWLDLTAHDAVLRMELRDGVLRTLDAGAAPVAERTR